MFDNQRNSLLGALDTAHDAYYRAEVFGGPSLHFHLRGLEAARSQDFERFAEYVYAVLASWGMHRMGPGGSKMREFEGIPEFIASRLASSLTSPREDARGYQRVRLD
jgi:hypothetical protein